MGTLEGLEDGVATFAATTAAKMRSRKLCASALSVFVQTNPFATSGPRFSGSLAAGLGVASNDGREIVGLALGLVRKLHRPGFEFKRAGVEAWDLVPESSVQGCLFDLVDRDKQARLQQAQDRMAKRWGPEFIRLGVQGTGMAAKMRREYLSKRYTTAWSELLEIDLDR